MRRAEIAQKFAADARDAEARGEHKRAAELFASALRVLLDRPIAELAQTTDGKLRLWLERQRDRNLEHREPALARVNSADVERSKTHAAGTVMLPDNDRSKS